ncbi:LCP family protein [Phytoactinopolyspora alkaliphila]|uniref:LCP family protein n=1 Tax=Phytoactinopolyspora alkaliphila TaxID=1783498 RepID=A0A6N9YH54_9ACTN|nr:LCP family protein [Phytoactinopolyspora alkaliphila]NED94282.1 LCP family protein [Phytoactinopolyspora alkaliphila]
MSVVAPGSAQLLRGNRRFGKIALSVWGALILIVLLVAWRTSTNDLAKLAVQPWILTTVRLLAFVLALAWIAVLVDAWRLGHPPGLNRKHRLVMVGATIGLAVIVSTPFVVAARYAEAAHDLVVRMFPSGEVAAASNGRLNILLLGADSGDGRDGTRPDSIHVASVDVLTGEPALISLPRNLERARFASGTPAAAQFPQGFTGDGDRSEYLLNATWTYGEANPELFEGESGPGPTAVKQAVEGTLGIKIHYYVAVDLMGFRELIDALGGVTLNVNEELPIGDKGRVLEPGLQTLDGYHALWYARSRESTSDYDRMARQRCVLGALFTEADPRTVLMNFLDVADASVETVSTDIPRQDLSNLVDLAFEAKDQELMSLQFVPPLIVPADPDFALMADQTAELLSGAGRPDATAGQATGSDDAGDEHVAASDDDPGSDSTASNEPSGGSSEPADEQRDETAGESGEGEAGESGEPVGVSSVCSYE